jgi:hypothetical protein
MKNLHPIQRLLPEQYLGTVGEHKYRHTGRSTAIAFDILASTYRNPSEWVKIRDHHDTTGADRCLFYMICKIIEKLEYESFERRADSSGYYIRLHYEP